MIVRHINGRPSGLSFSRLTVTLLTRKETEKNFLYKSRAFIHMVALVSGYGEQHDKLTVWAI